MRPFMLWIRCSVLSAFACFLPAVCAVSFRRCLLMTLPPCLLIQPFPFGLGTVWIGFFFEGMIVIQGMDCRTSCLVNTQVFTKFPGYPLLCLVLTRCG